MDFLEELQNCPEDQLENFVKARIKKYEEKSKKFNPNVDTIGYKIGINPTQAPQKSPDSLEEFNIRIQSFYYGYIRKKTRIVYGLFYETNGMVCNQGKYYYVDDDDYILEFCKYIKNIEIENEYELIDIVLEFLRGYFGYLPNKERDELFPMFYSQENWYYPSTKEHSIKAFQGTGGAMCTEFSIFAQNILSLFDMDCCLLIGKEKVSENDCQTHAFNFLSFKSQKEGKEVDLLVDFSNFVTNYDMNFHKIGESPFIAELEQFDEDFLISFIDGKRHLVYEDYAYYFIGDTVAKIAYDRTRDYYVERTLTPDINGKQRK